MIYIYISFLGSSASRNSNCAIIVLLTASLIPVPKKTIDGTPQKIPHIGWNELNPIGSSERWNKTILQDNKDGDAAYFVHSFMAVPTKQSHYIASCVYGGHRIPAVIGRENIIGCQFHPEKSGEVGLKIINRFCNEY